MSKKKQSRDNIQGRERTVGSRTGMKSRGQQEGRLGWGPSDDMVEDIIKAQGDVGINVLTKSSNRHGEMRSTFQGYIMF